MSKPVDVVNYRVRIKTALVAGFGGKCQLCGNEYPQSVFEFHHLNPKEKSFGLACSSTTRSRDAYAKEAKKCAMLCANCHRLVEHEGIGQNLIADFNEEVYWTTLNNLVSKNKKIAIEKKKDDTRIRPNKEQLIKDLNELNGNFSAVGRKYGFTGNAVVKWCKKFDMPYHSSDYKK